jgi:hypothetical protein
VCSTCTAALSLLVHAVFVTVYSCIYMQPHLEIILLGISPHHHVERRVHIRGVTRGRCINIQLVLCSVQ